jgi:predicted metalloprotease
MDVSDDVGYWRQNQAFTRALASHTVAHEYAHAMQQLTRILPAYYSLRYQSSPAKALEVNRRMELQASCLGNVFLGTNKGSYGIKGQLYTQWLYIVNNSGDNKTLPRDHGSTTSHGFWSRRGFAARNPSACNTFAASPRQVS